MMEYERTHPILGGSSFTLFCLTDSHCTIAFLRMELPSSTAPSDPPRGWDLQWSGTLAKPFGGKTAQECWKWLGGVLLVCICKYIQYIYIYICIGTFIQTICTACIQTHMWYPYPCIQYLSPLSVSIQVYIKIHQPEPSYLNLLKLNRWTTALSHVTRSETSSHILTISVGWHQPKPPGFLKPLGAQTLKFAG